MKKWHRRGFVAAFVLQAILGSLAEFIALRDWVQGADVGPTLPDLSVYVFGLVVTLAGYIICKDGKL